MLSRIAALLLLAPLAALAQDRAADALRRDIDFAKEKVYPALVNISVVVEQFSNGRVTHAPAAGSGVIVSPGGHVLTNFHVAGNTTRITCTLPTGETIESMVVAHDPLTDLSVLKLLLEKRVDPTIPVPFATVGDSAALAVGDYVLAMGNPLTLSSSMTLGIVSNTERVFTDFTGTEMEDMDLGEGEKTGLFTRWIQHDALILPGNSGGPLVNLRGEVVGINELGGSGVGFAIPSNIAAKVLNQALTYGEVRRGWLGLSVLPVGKLGKETGALVSAVAPGSPAEAAGLRPGDLLLTLDREQVQVRFFEQVPPFYERIADMPQGKTITVEFERGGEPGVAKATVARMEKFLGEEREFARMGVTARAITGPMALVRRYPSTEGVVVTGLRPGLAFEEARPKLDTGDVLLSVAGKKVTDLAAFAEALDAVKDGDEALVAFRRKDEDLVTVIKPTEDKEKTSGRELAKAWFGAKTQVLTADIAKALGIPGTKGYRLTEVFPGTAASKAGLKAGDILVALNGEDLTASRLQDEEDLKRAVEDLSPGDEAKLTVLRDGAKTEIAVSMEPTPAAVVDAKKSEQEGLDFTVRDLTFIDLIQNRWEPGTKGVLVADAPMGGWANMGGLHVGDLLLGVCGREVTDVASFEKAMEAVHAGRPKVIDLYVRREHRTHFVFVEPDWSTVTESK